MSPISSGSFSYARMRNLVRAQYARRSLVYWCDMLVSMAIGYTAASQFLLAPLLSPKQIVCYFIAGFALFRLGSFIHEIVHLRQGEMRSFRIAWNILAGIPMLMPSHFYGNHIDHHSDRHYGTGQDGEYLPVEAGLGAHLGNFALQAVLLPGWVAVRFLFLTPLSLVHPGIRRWTRERWSSFVFNFGYHRPAADKPQHWSWTLVEIACCLRVWGIPTIVLVGAAPWYRMVEVYLLGIFAMGLNGLRNVVAHRYLSSGEPMSHEEQLRDSITIEGGWLTELFFPLGLRYHALHHLFPAIPYHNLPAAHRRLMEELPADAAYRQSVYPTFWSAFAAVLGDIQRAKDDGGNRAATWYRRRMQWNQRRRPSEQPAAETIRSLGSL